MILCRLLHEEEIPFTMEKDVDWVTFDVGPDHYNRLNELKCMARARAHELAEQKAHRRHVAKIAALREETRKMEELRSQLKAMRFGSLYGCTFRGNMCMGPFV